MEGQRGGQGHRPGKENIFSNFVLVYDIYLRNLRLLSCRDQSLYNNAKICYTSATDQHGFFCTRRAIVYFGNLEVVQVATNVHIIIIVVFAI